VTRRPQSCTVPQTEKKRERKKRKGILCAKARKRGGRSPAPWPGRGGVPPLTEKKEKKKRKKKGGILRATSYSREERRKKKGVRSRSFGERKKKRKKIRGETQKKNKERPTYPAAARKIEEIEF